MNHTIIKKALNEALTQKYYDELMDCDDEEHIFGVGFTADMKRLIRKTDDKLLYYAKYAAIAACACIAVGCAVLLPKLINSGINTQPPVTTTPALESNTTTPAETTLPIIITTTEGTTTVTVTTTPDETVSEAENDVNPGRGPDTVTETTTTQSTTPPVTTTEEKVTETEDTEEEIDDADAIYDSPDSDGDIIIDAEGDDCVILPDDGDDAETDAEEEEEVEIEDDADEDVSTDSDDDVVIEEEADEEVEIEDDEPAEEKPVSASTLAETIGYFLWDDITAEIANRIYAVSVYGVDVMSDGAMMEDYRLNASQVDLSFIADYIESQKNAPRITENYPATDSGNYLVVTISDVNAFVNCDFNDYSTRNDYDYYFGGGIDEDADAEDDEDFGNELTLCISEKGFIWIERYGYETVYFDTDDTATATLFSTLESRKPASEPKTAADFLTLGVSADNIYSAYGDVRGVYDLDLRNVNFDTAKEKNELVSFINKFRSRALTKHSSSMNYTDCVYVVIGLKNRPTVMNIIAKDNRLYFYIEGMGYYYTSLTRSELEEFINLICKTGGVAQPYYYTNAYDYLVNAAGSVSILAVSHTDYENGSNITYNINDTAKLSDFYNFIIGELKTAEYKPYAPSGTSYAINVKLSDNCYMHISKDDTITIIGNKFYASEGFYNRVLEYLDRYAEKQVELIAEEEDDLIVEDDVEIEDEIDE